MKIAQILAMRRDAFSQVFCDELARLHDHARGFPGEIARQIIERELGGPVDEFFEEFSITPLAAASIGQTHEARLRHNGVRVVVKVQRPEAVEAFRSDLRFLKFLIGIIDVLGVLASGRWDEMLWELEKTFTEELDYRLEATSISRMRKHLRSQKVYAPRVFQRFCTRRVLVMEFVEGVFMSEYIHVAQEDPERIRAWTRENNVSPKRVGKKLYLSHLQQVFEDNLYHCDLHPGNIVLLRDDRFALIDFGAIASFEKSFLEKYSLMFQAIATRDFTKVVDIMLITSPALPDKDLTDLRLELLRKMRVGVEDDDQERAVPREIAHDRDGVSGGGPGKYEVPPAWEFLRLQRAEITLDSSLALLLPDVNYIKLSRTYMEKSQRRTLARARSEVVAAPVRGRAQHAALAASADGRESPLRRGVAPEARDERRRGDDDGGRRGQARAVGPRPLRCLRRRRPRGRLRLPAVERPSDDARGDLHRQGGRLRHLAESRCPAAALVRAPLRQRALRADPAAPLRAAVQQSGWEAGLSAAESA